MLRERVREWVGELREEPMLSWLRRAAKRTRNAVADYVESHKDWRRLKHVVDREFDQRYGVDTGGVTRLSGLRIRSQRVKHAVSHIAMDPREMEAALGALDAAQLDPARFTFVDLGAGKGRALLIASLRPFRRIIGVEFAPELARVAALNVQRFHAPAQRCRELDVVCMDAAAFELPEGPLVVFMYNPFGPAVMREVAAHVLDTLRRAPRELYVLYANPFHAEPWTECGFSELVRGPTFVLLGAPAVEESARSAE
jgi:SAM-dependent methyltransferase